MIHCNFSPRRRWENLDSVIKSASYFMLEWLRHNFFSRWLVCHSVHGQNLFIEVGKACLYSRQICERHTIDILWDAVPRSQGHDQIISDEEGEKYQSRKSLCRERSQIDEPESFISGIQSCWSKRSSRIFRTTVETQTEFFFSKRTLDRTEHQQSWLPGKLLLV